MYIPFPFVNNRVSSQVMTISGPSSCWDSCPDRRDARHEKTDLKVFVVVISFFGYDTEYKILLYCLHKLYLVVGVIPKEGLAGFDNDKDLRVCFLMTRVMYNQKNTCHNIDTCPIGIAYMMYNICILHNWPSVKVSANNVSLSTHEP